MTSEYQTSDIVEEIPNTEPSHKQCGQKHQISGSHKADIPFCGVILYLIPPTAVL